MSDKPIRNPCTFKSVCRQCQKVGIDDRPTLCRAIECEDFRTCPGCGLNKTLHPSPKGNLCSNCLSNASGVIRDEVKKIAETIKTGSLTQENQSSSSIPQTYIGSLSFPGVPPEKLSPEEKEYYQHRWKEFEGYYRNPAAYYNCHQLILLEIYSSYLNNKLVESRGELAATLSRDLQVASNLRKLVNDQLPDKEAEDVMDDEKSLCIIYERYREEKKLRSLGRVSRVFRADSIALAPNILFPIDPRELLEKCGFRIAEFEQILPKLEELAKDKTPEEVLKFFGFKLDEVYALDSGVVLNPEEIAEDLFGEEEDG